MRLYIVSNSDETTTGLRLAGIEGVTVNDADEAKKRMLTVAEDEDIGVIIVNRALMTELGGFVSEFRSSHPLPIIVEVPDTSGLPAVGSVARYVREAVGIKE